MVFAKIDVKNDYKEKGDLVFRPLSRVYQMLKTAYGVKDESVPLVGIVNNNGDFYELTTWRKIDDVDYQIINEEEFDEILSNLKLENLIVLRHFIKFVIFNEQSKIDYGISSIEDLAEDRKIDFEGYLNSLTNVNPYSEPLNGYNDFMYKCRMNKEFVEGNHGRKI